MRQRVASRQFELRPERNVAVSRVAVQQIVRVRLLVAEGPEHPLRGHPAKERRRVREPRVERNLVPVVPLSLAVVGADDVVDTSQRGSADVVHRDDAAVQRAHDVDERIVAEALQRVGLSRQVVERPVEPACIHLNTGHQFVLHAESRFDVVHALDVGVG